MDDGESHTETFFFGGEELLEEPFPGFVGNARAVIAHAELQGLFAVAFRSDIDFSAIGWCLAHGIKGVAEKVY